ncbi:MAG: AAA family ATPase [Chitinivibrionia bacterium]|nr:AAA family ATPase [Chitinivibrionia bacterium]
MDTKHLDDWAVISQSEVGQIMSSTKKAVLIKGNHGIGKTQILKTWGLANGFDVIVLLGAQMADAGDLIGVPFRSEDGNNLEYSIPAKFKGENKKLLILDELNRSAKDIRDSFFSLALEGEIPQTGYKLPQNSRVAATMNPDNEYYQVDTLDPALLDRFHRFELVVNPREWLTWASGQNINKTLLEFLNKNQNLITQIGCRAWFELGELENSAIGNFKIATSKVGKSAASLWVEYFRKNIDSWEEVFKNIEERDTHEVCCALDRAIQILSGMERKEDVAQMLEIIENVVENLQKNKRMEELGVFNSLYNGECFVYLSQSPKIRQAISFFICEV